MKRGHVPKRTCSGCSRRLPKARLLRFTLGPEGLIPGDGPGRGHYVCSEPGCLDRVLGRRNLSRLLGRPLDEEEALRLREALLAEAEDSGGREDFPESGERR